MRLSVLISVTPAGNWPYWPALPSLTGDLLPIADLIAREPVFLEHLVDFLRREALREYETIRRFPVVGNFPEAKPYEVCGLLAWDFPFSIPL